MDRTSCRDQALSGLAMCNLLSREGRLEEGWTLVPGSGAQTLSVEHRMGNRSESPSQSNGDTGSEHNNRRPGVLSFQL